MAETKKLSRKELLGPDEFIKDAGIAISWVDQHRRELIAGVGVAVGALVLWFAGTATLERGREQAFARYGAVEKAVAAAEADASAEKLQAVEDALKALREAHGGSAAARLAAYRVGAFRADRGEWEAATPLLEEAARAGGPPGALAGFRLAGALEAGGKLDEALSRYRAAAEAKASPVREEARLGAARVLDLKGDKEGARKAYESFAADFPDSPRAAVARDRAESLKAG